MELVSAPYTRKPLMRVERQRPSLVSDAFMTQTLVPDPFAHRHAVFRIPNDNLKSGDHHVEKNSQTAKDSIASEGQGIKSRKTKVFHNTSFRDMSSRYRSSSKDISHRNAIDSREMTPELKRRKLKHVTEIMPKKQRLRPSRPVKNSDDVNSDVWQNILSYCEPRFLLDARTINSFFNNILADRHAIWKSSRQKYYGESMPDCPKGLTEKQYVDLLVGKGCQSSVCTKENTAKVYWVFLARLCQDCLAKKTMREEDVPPERRHAIDMELSSQERAWSDKKELWSLLPMASSTGRRYVNARGLDVQNKQWAFASQHCIFLKSQYDKVEAEYLQFLESSPSKTELSTWWDQKHSQNMEYMAEIKPIETWYDGQMYLRQDLRRARRVYFRDRASELTPPMDMEVLMRMAAFHKALGSSNIPTMRSWQILKGKILPYRDLAEHLIQVHKDMFKGRSCPDIARYRDLQNRREGRRLDRRILKEEQEFVLRLARREFDGCLRAGVADVDLVLLTLKNVFSSYEKVTDRPVGLNYDGTMGPYILSMDDARMIVEDVVEEHVQRYSQRGATVLENFICAGCDRSDHVRKWSFGAAFEHIFATHAQVVGEGLEFWRFAIPFPRDHEYHRRFCWFPWYTVRWPQNLPLLPGHQDLSKTPAWHPDLDLPYQKFEETECESAFANRSPRKNSNLNEDFVSNMVYAADVFKDVQLTCQCLTKIALRYALDLLGQVQTEKPSLDLLTAAVVPVRNANPTMNFRFRCGLCMDEGKAYRSAKHVKYTIPIEQLVTHWKEKHQMDNADWTKNLMFLPSGAQVLEQILNADQKLRNEQQTVSARESSLLSSARKRPGLKAQVIMTIPFAMDRFDRLFDRLIVGESTSESHRE